MSEELTPEQLQDQIDQISEDQRSKLSPLEEQMDLRLVEANITEAIISDLKERYLSLKIAGIEDKETYLTVKEGRKNCKALRVMAKKICTDGREDAVAIQKAWVAKEKEVTGRIAEVEDYLEEQEKAYEKEVAAEKDARKRKQEEQLIMRQQELTSMGALYADGNFVLGDVAFELSSVKESDDDVWSEVILPKFHNEYRKLEHDRLEQERIKEEKEAELKRQKEELEAERKRLKEEADRLQAEKERQELEAANKRSQQFEFRSQQLKSIGFEVYGVDWYVFREFKIAMVAVWDWDDNAWGLQLGSAKQYVEQVLEEEAEEKRKEQERQELQNKRYAELYPYTKYGIEVKMDQLWSYTEDQYVGIYEGKKAAFQEAEDARIAELEATAAKKERERIEEEQRQAEVNRMNDLIRSRNAVLDNHGLTYFNEKGHLAEMSEDRWLEVFRELVDERDEILRKQEEDRKAEELAKASEKVKWANILEKLSAIEIPKFISGQYAKKAAILREKLEEIKVL